MQRHQVIALASVVLVVHLVDPLATSKCRAETTNTIEDLGSLGGQYAWARSVNNLGEVAGTSTTPGSETYAFTWRNGQMTIIGTGPVDSNPTADSFGINDAGQVVGHAYNDDGLRHGFLYQNAILSWLPTLAGGFTGANAVSEDGVIVGFSDDSSGKRQAVTWSSDSINRIDLLTGRFNSSATSINSRGNIAGSAFDTPGRNVGYFWSDESTTLLSAVSGQRYASASGLNDHDWVVGKSWTNGPRVDPFATLWIDGQAANLGTVGDYTTSWAEGINNLGQIVGSLGGYQIGSAFLWQDGTMYDLNAMLAHASDYFIVNAHDINDLGQIAAQAKIPSGDFHPVLLTPIPDTVAAKLDIKPGSCPNPMNPRSRGRIPVAIVGTESLDIAEIDDDTIRLRRGDGIGGDVAPMAKHSGRIGAIDEVASPFDGESCGCHEFGGDGLDDLVLHFSTIDMVRTLELDSAERDSQVELTLYGSLFDGTRFEATDCITIVGQPHRATLRARGRSR